MSLFAARSFACTNRGLQQLLARMSGTVGLGWCLHRALVKQPFLAAGEALTDFEYASIPVPARAPRGPVDKHG